MHIDEIKDCIVNEKINGVFAVSDCKLKAFKQKEGYFLSCKLSDKTGSLPGMIWENAPKMKWLKNKMVVLIRGTMSLFRNQPQIIINSIEEVDRYDKSLLVPSLDLNTITAHHEDLCNRMMMIDDKYKFLWSIIIENDNFKHCPGGIGNVHHNYLGGLQQHCHDMMFEADNICETYDFLDKQLLMTGILVHDIGKIRAYNWDVVIEMTDIGRLYGHIPIGFNIVAKIFEKKSIDCCSMKKICHMILSHHGDHGGVKPMFIEAKVLSNIDSNDASINYMRTFIEEHKQNEGNWTEWSNLMQTYFYDENNNEFELPIEENDVELKNIEDDSKPY